MAFLVTNLQVRECWLLWLLTVWDWVIDSWFFVCMNYWQRSLYSSGAGPGFWFERGNGMGSEGRKSPAGSRGRAPEGVWGKAPRSLKNVTSWGWKTTYYRREKKSIETDIVWHFTDPFMLLCFQLKRSLQASEPAKWATMAAGSVVQLVLCNLWYFDTQAIALGGEIIIGLIERVCWKKHYCNDRKLVK